MFHKPNRLWCHFSSEVQRETLLFGYPSLIKILEMTNIAIIVQLRSERAATEETGFCPISHVKSVASVWCLAELNQVK